VNCVMIVFFFLSHICHEYTLTSSGCTDTFWGLRVETFNCAIALSALTRFLMKPFFRIRLLKR
jgi:hypothetical protein